MKTHVSVYVSGELAEQFIEKCASNKLKRVTVMRALVQAYVDGKIDVAGQDSFVVNIPANE